MFLNRFLDIFQRIKVEQKIDEIRKRIEQLVKNQDNLDQQIRSINKQTDPSVFKRLSQEQKINNKEYLVGNLLTEADVRLIPTLLRFDSVYYVHFKCNFKKISEFKNISTYVKRLFNNPAINSTTNFDHIKRHYYFSHEHINPHRIIPIGPENLF